MEMHKKYIQEKASRNKKNSIKVKSAVDKKILKPVGNSSNGLKEKIYPATPASFSFEKNV